MQTVMTIGLDIAKSVFQLHGIDAAGSVVNRANRPNTWLRRPMLLRRKKSLPTRSRPHMALSGRNRHGLLTSAFDRLTDLGRTPCKVSF